MRRAQTRDAILEKKFFFRTNLTSACDSSDAPNIHEMTVEQIINGDPQKNFPGLLPIVQVN